MARIAEWNARAVINESQKATDKHLKRIANQVRRDAQALCPKRTGQLAASIKVFDSKYETAGGLRSKIVMAGDDDAWYAFQVETGTQHTHAQPFLRPALERARKTMRKYFGVR